MGIVAALLPSAVQLQRLETAIGGRHELRLCDDWAMLRLVCEREPIHLAVLDVYAGGAMSLEPVRQLRRRHPRLITVAYVSVSAERLHDLFDAGRAGLEGLVIAGRDDSPETLSSILEQAEARGVAGVLRAMLEPYHPSVGDAVMVAVTRAHEQLNVESLARKVSLPRRGLTRRLLDAGFPAPQQLLTWGRLIIAAQMMEDHHRSADGVAASLHFPSGSAFRNVCQRYLRTTPTQLRALGGAQYVIRLLFDDVTARRGRSPGRDGSIEVEA